MTQEARPLSRAAMEAYFGYLLNQGRNTVAVRLSPSPRLRSVMLTCVVQNWYAHISLYGGPDSQINARDLSFSAYAHRSALWVFQIYGRSKNWQPPLADSIVTFIGGMADAVTKTQSDGDFDAYLNYQDPTLSVHDAHRLYFGDQLYNRLLNIKNAVDPARLFWNPQAVGADQ